MPLHPTRGAVGPSGLPDQRGLRPLWTSLCSVHSWAERRATGAPHDLTGWGHSAAVKLDRQFFVVVFGAGVSRLRARVEDGLCPLVAFAEAKPHAGKRLKTKTRPSRAAYAGIKQSRVMRRACRVPPRPTMHQAKGSPEGSKTPLAEESRGGSASSGGVQGQSPCSLQAKFLCNLALNVI